LFLRVDLLLKKKLRMFDSDNSTIISNDELDSYFVLRFVSVLDVCTVLGSWIIFWRSCLPNYEGYLFHVVAYVRDVLSFDIFGSSHVHHALLSGAHVCWMSSAGIVVVLFCEVIPSCNSVLTNDDSG